MSRPDTLSYLRRRGLELGLEPGTSLGQGRSRRARDRNFPLALVAARQLLPIALRQGRIGEIIRTSHFTPAQLPPSSSSVWLHPPPPRAPALPCLVPRCDVLAIAIERANSPAACCCSLRNSFRCQAARPYYPGLASGLSLVCFDLTPPRQPHTWYECRHSIMSSFLATAASTFLEHPIS